MLRYDLLNKELDYYAKRGMTKVSQKYSIKYIKRLLTNYDYFGMTESEYCCRGEEDCCWQELIEVGNWGLTKHRVKLNILRNFKSCSKYLYNGKYPDRFNVYKDEKYICIHVYMRDIIRKDFAIWFSNIDE